MKLELGEFVEADIGEATDWYEDQRSGLGDELLEEIALTIQRVTVWPLAFPRAYQEIRRAGVTRFPYAVYFRVTDDRIVILAVTHGSRDPKEWQSRV